MSSVEIIYKSSGSVCAGLCWCFSPSFTHTHKHVSFLSPFKLCIFPETGVIVRQHVYRENSTSKLK